MNFCIYGFLHSILCLWDSSMLLVFIVYSHCFMVFYEYIIMFYPSNCSWTPRLFPICAIMNSTALNIFIYVFWWTLTHFGGRVFTCINCLLLHNKSPQNLISHNKNKHCLSLFKEWGIWEQLGKVVLVMVSHEVVVIWWWDWVGWICFQGSSLTQLVSWWAASVPLHVDFPEDCLSVLMIWWLASPEWAVRERKPRRSCILFMT